MPIVPETEDYRREPAPQPVEAPPPPSAASVRNEALNMVARMWSSNTPAEDDAGPEQYDRTTPFEKNVAPYLRAFAAGAIDPAGLPSTVLNMILKADPKSEALRPQDREAYLKSVERMRAIADWYARRMQEFRDESPAASGAGSAVLPALIAGPLVGGPVLGAGSVREAMTVVPPIMGIGGAFGKVNSVLSRTTKQRPQARYPTGGK